MLAILQKGDMTAAIGFIKYEDKWYVTNWDNRVGFGHKPVASLKDVKVVFEEALCASHDLGWTVLWTGQRTDG